MNEEQVASLFDNPMETNPTLIADFQNVFSTDAGARVLTFILSQACFFKELENDEERVLHNFAKKLTRYLGKWEYSNMYALTQAILSVKNYTDIYVDVQEE